MAARDLILDQYAPLSHKEGLRDGSLPLARTWIPTDQQRRLSAYRLLHAALANVARHFFTGDADDNADMVEYGDAALLVSRVAAAVLGDDPAAVVDGAEVDDLPSIGARPADPPEDATPIEQRIAAARLARWERDAEVTVAEWEAAVASQPERAARQAWIRETLEADDGAVKLGQFLAYALGLGDGVAVVGWDPDADRPTLAVYDPGFYFPGAGGTVHLAWEETSTLPGGGTETFVRRLTYELAGMADETGAVVDGVTTCWLTDGRWKLNALGSRRADDLLDGEAVELTVTDLGIDFVPVIWSPGVDVGDDFGKSILADVAQILDEIIATDTDVSKAQSFAAGPTVALSGSSLADTTVEPGAVYNIAAEGKMSVLDLSQGLREVRDARSDLLSRLSVNGQVPPEVLGRIEGVEALSGVAIALRFGPFASYIRSLRASIVPRLNTILDYWQRLGLANGAIDGDVHRARWVPGSFLPSDRAALVTEVSELLKAKAISQETAVHLLVAGGLPVPDAAGEVARIRAGDPQGAKAVAEALADEAAAAAWLGVPPPAPAPADGTLGGQ